MAAEGRVGRVREPLDEGPFPMTIEINGMARAYEEPMVRIRLSPAESPRLARFCPLTARGRLFARVCGPGRCSAVSRDGYRAMHGADRREYLCRANFQYRGVDAAVA